jgi:transglutaminase-like putative cysteine protease
MKEIQEQNEDNRGREEEYKHNKEPWYKGPIKIILGIFLLLLIVMWLVPFYGIKQNPEPYYLPTITELTIPELTVPDVIDNDIRYYVQTTQDIKQIADKIVTLSCKETHKVCNAKAIFYFVQSNFNYLNDPLAFEYFKTPQESFNAQAGDCDDASILLSSLLQSIGLQTRFVYVPGHVYVQVRMPEAKSSYKDEDDWINLDATCQNCKFGEISYTYSDSKKTFTS